MKFLLPKYIYSFNIFFAGLSQLKKELTFFHGNMCINALCTKSGNEFKFSCFQSAAPLEDIKIQFDVMFQQYPTEIYCRIWEAHMEKASKSELCIEDIKTQIWNPAFRECVTLLNSIREQTIELNQVDHYFKILDQQKIKRELVQLHSGIMQCRTGKKEKFDHEWIDEAVNLMERYWSLHTLAGAAKIVMTLRDDYSLTGDFRLIETLAQQVKCMLQFYLCVILQILYRLQTLLTSNL